MTEPRPNSFNLGRPEPTPQPQPQPIKLPDEIGGYRIQRVLGSGGMATVYAALQTQPRRTVALKVMKAGVSLTRGDAAYRRFKREIEILGKLHHPYIAQIYGAGVHDDGGGAVPYFVMEYVPGAKTMTEFIATKQLDWRERLKLFVKVCAAVEHGHRNKVIHRDLKPANILIDQAGEPKIIDFGVAQATELDVASQTMHTEAGRIVGTLQYMSPEQLDSSLQNLDARCDVYALGVLLYKLLTGKPPHDLHALPVYEAVRIIREESPVHPRELKPELFRGRGDLETIILKAMEPDRSRRYRNAGSLGRDIVRFLADKPINARRASLLHRARLFAKRHRAALTSSAIVAMVMLIALGIVMYDRLSGARQARLSAIDQSPLIDDLPSRVRAPAVGDGVDRSDMAASPLHAASLSPFLLRAHTGSVTQLAFAPDGTRLVSAAHDRSLLTWNMQTRQMVATLGEFDAAITHLCFNRKATLLAAAGDGDFCWIGDLRNANEDGTETAAIPLNMLRFAGNRIRALALDPAGNRIAVALDDLTLRVQSSSSRVASAPLIIRSTTGAFTCIAFSHDGTFLAAGSHGGAVHLWNATDGALVARLSDLQGEVVSIGFAFSLPVSDGPDDQLSLAHDQIAGDEDREQINRLIAITVDGMAAQWPLVGDEVGEPARFVACASPMVSVAFDPTGQWLACAAATAVNIWNVSSATPAASVAPLKLDEVAYAVAIDPTGTWCAVGHANGDIAVFPLIAPPQ